MHMILLKMLIMHGIFAIFYKIVPKTFVMFILIGFKNLYHLIPYMKWGLQLRLGPPKNWRPRVDGASSFLEAPILKLEAPNFLALRVKINLGPPHNFFPEYALAEALIQQPQRPKKSIVIFWF